MDVLPNVGQQQPVHFSEYLKSLCIYHSLLQLGQPSVNPPRLVLEVGGTSTKQAAMPGELKSPPHLEA